MTSVATASGNSSAVGDATPPWFQNTLPSVAVWDVHDWLIAYGNGIFLAVTGTKTGTSSDGVTWTSATALGVTPSSLTFANDRFFVTSDYDVYSTTNGTSWITVSSGSDRYTDMAYGNGTYVAVGTTYSLMSTDGVSFTSHAMHSIRSWGPVSFLNGVFISLGPMPGRYQAAIPYVMSYDGITWTAPTTIGGLWGEICYGNGTYVAVGTTNQIVTSYDLINWTFTSLNYPYRIAYGNGIFVAVFSSGVGAQTTDYYTSPDGITWTTRTLPVQADWIEVKCISGQFILVSGVGYCLTSFNGVTWARRTGFPILNSYSGGTLHYATNIDYDLAFGNDTCVFVGGVSTRDAYTLYLPPQCSGIASGHATGVFVGGCISTSAAVANGYSAIAGVGYGVAAQNALANATGSATANAVSHSTAYSDYYLVATMQYNVIGAANSKAIATAVGSTSDPARGGLLHTTRAIATGSAVADAVGSGPIALIGTASAYASATAIAVGYFIGSVLGVATAVGSNTTIAVGTYPGAHGLVTSTSPSTTSFISHSAGNASATLVGSSTASFNLESARLAQAVLTGTSSLAAVGLFGRASKWTVTTSPSAAFIGSHSGTYYIGTGGVTGARSTDPQLVFYAAEISAYKPGSSSLTISEGHGVHPHGTLAQFPDSLVSTNTLYASDVGYRTSAAIDGDPVPYPPIITQAFAINRAVNLAPGDSSISAAWGSLILANIDKNFDGVVANWNNSGRSLSIYCGNKTLENFYGTRTAAGHVYPSRGIFIDPPYDELTLVFKGIQQPWFLTENALEIPLRDASYWLEQPVQNNLYLGTGSYQGTTSLLGAPLPKARGGTTGNPIRNITPVLVDPIAWIYQYTDNAGSVVNLYEGAATTITFQANTTNLYSGSTTAGHYRTDNSRGLFQLGSAPSATITADVTGNFASAGAVTNVVDIARYLLLEDCLVPSSNVSSASFDAALAGYNYTGGIYLSNNNISGLEAVDQVLASIGAKLYPDRDGTLRVLVLRVPSGTPSHQFDTSNTVSLTASRLPTTIDPSPYRMRVGHDHNYTVQTSGLLGAATASQIQFAGLADKFSAAANSAVLASYVRPNDVAPITTCLLGATNSQIVADELIDLWGVRRRLYNIVVPLVFGLTCDLGDVVQLTWPVDNLVQGQLGIIIAESFVSIDSTITFDVLV